MAPQPPPRDRRGMRTGFTTGACAAAAAKAATRCLVQNVTLARIDTVLPNRDNVSFVLERCDVCSDVATCSVIKDAGDDPDCTHGAELVASVRLSESPDILITGGVGVATVTKRGLGLEVGTSAINPVPRRNITDMVRAELPPGAGARVCISVPDGEIMAQKTTNARLGLLGGISILGTTGIVRPYSTAAFKASVVQAINVLRERGGNDVVLTTGGKSEQYAMTLFPELPTEAFIQMGDFVGVAVRHAARRQVLRAHIVGMMGKLSKMADGRMQTHAAGSKVNLDMLADLANDCGAPEAMVVQARESTTARRVLELCDEFGVRGLPAALCQRAVGHAASHARAPIEVTAHLVDFGGALLGSFPRAPPAADDEAIRFEH